MRLGAGRGRSGTVVLLTLGTGIGSALFTDGVLVPNTEFGHIQIKGKDAEVRASAKARTDRGLSWEQWARRLGTYMRHLEALISLPDHRGRRVSRWSEHFVPLIEGVRAEIVPARLVNNAGIVGAAMAAAAAHPAETAPARVRAVGGTGAQRRRGTAKAAR